MLARKGNKSGVIAAPDGTLERPSARQFLSLLEYTGRAFALVLDPSRAITAWLAILSAVAGLLPAAIAYVGKLIVDAVVHSARHGGADPTPALAYVAIELGLVVVLAAAQRGLTVCESLLRALLG